VGWFFWMILVIINHLIVTVNKAFKNKIEIIYYYVLHITK
jgi:hypothetical protein